MSILSMTYRDDEVNGHKTKIYTINMQIIFDIIDLRSLESVGDVS